MNWNDGFMTIRRKVESNKIKILVLLFLIVIGIFFEIYKEIKPFLYTNLYIDKYLDKEDAALLAQESIGRNECLVFYLNKHGFIECAIIKNDIFFHRIIGISSGLSPGLQSYLFTSFGEKNEYFWIDWGVIKDDSIQEVLCNEMPMNIVDEISSEYRICWIIGKDKISNFPVHREVHTG